MKTITNEIIINCNYPSIDSVFDFFQLKSSDKYINKGSKILDLGLEGIRSIAFDDGASVFVASKKSYCKTFQLQTLVGDMVSVKKLNANDLKPYILAKLFLFNLANSDFEEYSFNNLSGKLYLFKPEWIDSNRKRFKALNIDIKSYGDASSKITCNACSFSSVKLFKSPRVLETFPRYVFSVKGTLKRTFEKDDSSYIRKAVSGKKAEIPFISFGKNDIDLCKANILLNTVDTFNKKYNGLISITLCEKEIARKIDTKRDEYYFNKIVLLLSQKDIYLSNYDKNPEDEGDFHYLYQKVAELLPFSNIIVSKEIKLKELNITLIHNQDYYIDNNTPDPYKTFDRSTPIQCVTVEDACSKNSDAIFKTIIKELQIKNEIINERRFMIDDWNSFGHKASWIFGMLVDNLSYFINVSPDGSFKLIKKSSSLFGYKEEIYNTLENLLLLNKGDDKKIVADDNGNINLIVDTSIIPLPGFELFKSDSPRGKESKNNNLCGVLDINLYEGVGMTRYSVGPYGKTLNISIPSAPHIYEARVVEGKEIMVNIIESLGVQFVKYNSFTVQPYPFKYLNEYVQMCKISKN